MLCLATLCGLLTRAAAALAIAKPAPGATPETVTPAGPRPEVLAGAGLLVALALAAVFWWYRSGRRR